MLKIKKYFYAIVETIKSLLLHHQPLGPAKQVVISGNHTSCHFYFSPAYATMQPPCKLPVVSKYECMPWVFLGRSRSTDEAYAHVATGDYQAEAASVAIIPAMPCCCLSD